MIGKLTEFVLFGFAPLLVSALFVPAGAAAEEISLTGEVFYRERMALPPSAVLTVRLVDVSLADAPADVIAEQTIGPAGQVPIKFDLRFDPAVVRPRMTYALQARITVDEKLWFINDERHAVDPANPEPQTILVKRVGQVADAGPSGLFGVTWLAEDIEGRGVMDYAQSTLVIASDGKVSGRGGCNSYFAAAEVDGASIRIGAVGSTFKACAPALMDQEHKFFAALGKAAGFRLDEQTGKLFLTDAGGAEILRFSKSE
jgi:putative lipoprotein